VRNLAFKVIDRLLLVVFGAHDPTDEEWIRFLMAVERHGIDRTMMLIVTDGGGPTPMQRRHLDELLAGRSVPVAVMSDRTAIRTAVRVLSWFNRKIRAFSSTGLLDAMAYLGIPSGRAKLLQAAIDELRLAVLDAEGKETPS